MVQSTVSGLSSDSNGRFGVLATQHRDQKLDGRVSLALLDEHPDTKYTNSSAHVFL